MDMDNSTMQALMNTAYEFWQAQKGMSKQQFWNSLDHKPRAAVAIGNLNYQVCNGGFSQWHYNGYSEAFGTIDYVCRQVGTPNSLAVLKLVEEAMTDLQEYDESEDNDEVNDGLDGLDSRFYAINEAFLEDVEAWLVKQ